MSAVVGFTRRVQSVGLVGAMVAAVAVVCVVTASPAAAAAPPVVQRPAGAVTADALPTVQINGVIWSMVIKGNTVYAGGEFTRARPAGSAPGQNEVVRSNLLAFDVTTGNLISSFAPTINAKVKTLALSPDGTKLYVGGAFTTVNGANRYRIAAFSTATGALDTAFAPGFNATITGITVSNSAVYAGGWFSNVNGSARTRLAAVNAANGALLAWAPTADADVDSITLTPDKTKVVVGGKFRNMNGTGTIGMGAVNATTGATEPWVINQTVQSGGPTASILSLKADDTAVYGSAFSYGSGNYEGTFSANPANGAINWLADCHGDIYDSISTNGVVYNVGHSHFCSNIGGFPDTNPRVQHHSLAFTKNANGTVLPNTQTGGHYANFGGRPAPSLIDWFPQYQIGTFTGQSQAAWSLAANSTYIVAGGEFPSVNGKAQQGLVRYAIPSASTNKIGPTIGGASWVPTAARTTNAIRLTWQTNVDRDDLNLSYSVFRSDRGTSPVYVGPAASTFWNRPSVTFNDTSYAPSTSYTYFVRATDPSGNQATSSSVTITSPATGGTPQNPPPVAAYTWSAAGLGVSFNGSGSTDNGSITSYAWNYGDGTSGTGATSSHTYGSAGSYQVTLTVTDNGGATNQITKTVTVGSSPPADAFNRNLSGSWGNADSGGAWSLSAPGSFSVDGSAGKATLGAANANLSAFLNAVSAQNVNITVQVAVDKVANGSGSQAMVVARRGDGSDYRFKVRFLATGGMNVVLSRVTAGAETSLGEVSAGTSYVPGQVFNLRFAASGSGSTTLTGKVWAASGSEPGTAQISRTDTTPALQDGGSVGLIAYLASSATNAPVVVSVDNLLVS